MFVPLGRFVVQPLTRSDNKEKRRLDWGEMWPSQTTTMIMHGDRVRAGTGKTGRGKEGKEGTKGDKGIEKWRAEQSQTCASMHTYEEHGLVQGTTWSQRVQAGRKTNTRLTSTFPSFHSHSPAPSWKNHCIRHKLSFTCSLSWSCYYLRIDCVLEEGKSRLQDKRLKSMVAYNPCSNCLLVNVSILPVWKWAERRGEEDRSSFVCWWGHACCCC